MHLVCLVGLFLVHACLFVGLKFIAIGLDGSWVFLLIGVEALVGWLLDHSDVQVTEFSDAETVSDEYSDEEVVEDVDDTPYPVVSGFHVSCLSYMMIILHATFLHLFKEPAHPLWTILQDLPTILLCTEQSYLFCCWDNDWVFSIKISHIFKTNHDND